MSAERHPTQAELLEGAVRTIERKLARIRQLLEHRM